MAKKKIAVDEIGLVLSAAAPRVEGTGAKRAPLGKHSKAKSSPVTPTEKITETPAATPIVEQMNEQDEIALVAYLYAEARHFQGGSPEEDWVRAEQEVRRRRA